MNENKKKIAFIINPISGTQSKEQILKWLDEKLDKERYAQEVIYTERAGHAVEIAAQKAQEDAHAVIAIGGDGTINEIARSLVHTKTALGIIPCGSGNGLARHLQIPMEPKKAIDIINDGLIDIIDYGKINDVPFFCTCGVGFDAFVSLQFSKAGRRGPLTYLEKTLLESLKYRPETYELEMDGSTLRYKAFLIACGNASQYGNNAYIAPQATLNDGLLDVTILEPFTVLDVPSLSFQLFNKTIDQNSRIKTFRCQTLRIHRSKPGVVHFDGDPMMMGENVDVKIMKKGLQVIVPRDAEKDTSNVLQRAQDYINGLKSRKSVVFCGDLNVAHQEIDLKNPKTNRHNAGFTDEERSCFDKVLASGYIDTYRYFYPDTEGVYSWWSYMFHARENNAGWRIDYFITSASIKEKIQDSKIHTEVFGSDHCPVELDIEL